MNKKNYPGGQSGVHMDLDRSDRDNAAIHKYTDESAIQQKPSELIDTVLQQLAKGQIDGSLSELDLDCELRFLSKSHRVGLRLIRDRFSELRSILVSAAQSEVESQPATPEQLAQFAAADEERRQLEGAEAVRQALIQEAASELAQSRNVFETWQADFEQTGYVAAPTLSRSLLVAMTARLLSVSTAFVFYGSSSSGKSDGILLAAQFLPLDTVLNITSVSEQAFYYLGGIAGRIVILGEIMPNRDGQDDYRQVAMRQLISENKIVRQVVEKADGHTNIAVKKETTGPCVLLATTTREPSAWNDELVNRASWIRTDATESATRAVIDRQAQRAMEPWQTDDERLQFAQEKWRAFVQRLESLAVAIPFAAEIRITSAHVTARRLNALVLNYVKISALLHQSTRQRKSVEGGRHYLIAELADYEIAYDLVLLNAPRTLDFCSDSALEMFEAIRKLSAYSPISTGRIQALVKQPKESIRRWLNELTEAGLLVREGRDGRQIAYTLGDAVEAARQDLGLVKPEDARAKFLARCLGE